LTFASQAAPGALPALQLSLSREATGNAANRQDLATSWQLASVRRLEDLPPLEPVAVLKTSEVKASVGSNPTPSVFKGSEGIRGNPKTAAVQPICSFVSSGQIR
jgi:hypothetical protein